MKIKCNVYNQERESPCHILLLHYDGEELLGGQRLIQNSIPELNVPLAKKKSFIFWVLAITYWISELIGFANLLGLKSQNEVVSVLKI